MESRHGYKPASQVDYQPALTKDEREPKTIPYWLHPTVMFTSLLGGVILAIGHHLFYNFWNNRLVDSDTQQQWIIRGGTAFAFCVKMLLAIAAGEAFIQQAWLSLGNRPHTIADIDSLFAVLNNALEFSNLKMWVYKPLLALTALFAWIIPFSAIVSPGTLIVVGSNRTEVQEMKVPTLHWANDSIYTVNDGYDVAAHWHFGTPTADLARMGIASATSMSLLQIQGPSPNCSYQMALLAPALSCVPANVSTYTKFKDQLAQWSTSSGDQYSTWPFFAWTGVMPAIGAPAADFNTSDTISENAAEIHIASGAYSPVIIQCSLHNASYLLNFTFENSQQSLQIENLTLINGVSTNPSVFARVDKISNYSGPHDLHYWQTISYTQTMQVFNQLLVGSVQDQPGLGDQPSTMAITNTISMSTAFNYIQPVSEKSLARVAESLFQNITLGLLSSDVYTTNVSNTSPIPVSIVHARNIYSYSPHGLFLAYGLAILATIIAVILGSIAIWRQGLSYSMNFSSILRATRDLRLHQVLMGSDDAHWGSSGADPTSRGVQEMRLVYRSRTKERWAGFTPLVDGQAQNGGGMIVKRKPVGEGTALRC